MATSGVFCVTGKMGSGKGLIGVAQIDDYLQRGRRIATNCDLFLHNLLPKTDKSARVTRFPDHPSIEDLYSIGSANETYDESKNGLIVFDECVKWLNTRNYRDKEYKDHRMQFIEWIVHTRKLGWDVYLLVQDVSVLDKQIRDLVIEHIVYCRRTDKMQIPYIGFIFRFFGVERILPQVHIGAVYYGMDRNAIRVDTWISYGSKYYSAYDTKQRFNAAYPHAIHSLLPPYYTHYKSLSKRGFKFVMRLTKIYFKKFNSIITFFIGILLCFFVISYFQKDSVSAISEPPKRTLGQRLTGTGLDEKDSDKSLEFQDSGVVDSVESDFDLSDYELVKLNFVVYEKYGVPVTRLMYGGLIYTVKSFPFELEWIDSVPFAYIPVSNIST